MQNKEKRIVYISTKPKPDDLPENTVWMTWKEGDIHLYDMIRIAFRMRPDEIVILNDM